jgi:hypothetical protein
MPKQRAQCIMWFSGPVSSVLIISSYVEVSDANDDFTLPQVGLRKSPHLLLRVKDGVPLALPRQSCNL